MLVMDREIIGNAWLCVFRDGIVHPLDYGKEQEMRKLDEKFHVDGDQVIKTSNGEPIPLDEPTFLMRARDYLAIRALEHYRQISLEDGCTDYHFSKLDVEIEKFKRFAQEHPERMKQPSITRGK